MYPKALIDLIDFLKKLPGVGSKTAERYAFELINWGKEELKDFGSILKNLKENIKKCSHCGCLLDNNYCIFCDSDTRDTNKLCIVSSFRDVFALESTHSFKGLYHIVDSLLSPIDGKDSNYLRLDTLKKRILVKNIKEIIIGLDSTIEGDATSLFFKEELKDFDIKISRLAFGLPMGTSIDYIDTTTLSQALVGRKSY